MGSVPPSAYFTPAKYVLDEIEDEICKLELTLSKSNSYYTTGSICVPPTSIDAYFPVLEPLLKIQQAQISQSPIALGTKVYMDGTNLMSLEDVRGDFSIRVTMIDKVAIALQLAKQVNQLHTEKKCYNDLSEKVVGINCNDRPFQASIMSKNVVDYDQAGLVKNCQSLGTIFFNLFFFSNADQFISYEKKIEKLTPQKIVGGKKVLLTYVVRLINQVDENTLPYLIDKINKFYQCLLRRTQRSV